MNIWGYQRISKSIECILRVYCVYDACMLRVCCVCAACVLRVCCVCAACVLRVCCVCCVYSVLVYMNREYGMYYTAVHGV